MRYATSSEHRIFFAKERFIEFEGLLSSEECSLLLSQKEGRDLWKQDPGVKKTSLKLSLAETAAELCNALQLRIGFDEKLKGFATSLSLQERSCLKGLSMGLLLSLSGEKRGFGTYFDPRLPLSSLPSYEDSFLIAYCGQRTFYLLEKNDPYTHLLKKEGYVFGDLLKNNTHPLVRF